MSKLSGLNTLLVEYHQLQYHHDVTLRQRLQQVQAWQKMRMQHTHQAHFSAKNNQLMADYFLNRLYGGTDFDALAQQIERLMGYAHKAEKMIPENAIKTGTLGITLAILAVRLDEEVAQQLLQDYPADSHITDEMMRLTYLKLNQEQDRLQQLTLLDTLGLSLDKYMRSFIIYTAFKMCKGAAQKYHFEVMYEFMQDGFIAMKPLKSAEQFVTHFTAIERDIIAKVHADHPNPFNG